ncbi:class I SAM-dependent methyltransferase [Clostridium sp. CM028]|uniref:class I SAM-dependent methyltransferase n=1 Tax=unclassified Clostridium TaxID=2614128 RepID=UPI001C6DE3BE|nr:MULTISPECIES: class I SAM-dependent methyltransferase [unclassified Clostridium]MBW9146610.1 class I SAM-dependent methyltransferase [Clostridium sp. CM027]MBW9149052.1 class I SAM-dependent methyltransferase [Clostridium sp. CM028]UVE42067.1 class I SAM-dependent methyltransferase [Clostridium sp. CM027]WLC62681.1 class I SAM-dependent methyltransferase [Clostridium sp. CM028]
MNIVYRQTELYKFLKHCQDISLEKTVLDCGAGGNCPPLGLFHEFGYETYGIELDDTQVQKSKEFELLHEMILNIAKGDMRHLPFEDNSISFVYSYNSIFHMKKQDIALAVNEIKRVLKPNGLCFINFLSLNNFGFEKGEKAGENEFLEDEDGEKVLHSYFDINEGDQYFSDMNILLKENRTLERIYEGKMITQGYIDYIVKK